MQLNQLVRRLVKAPAFTIIAVLTLAIGIGANSAIFSVVRGVLLKPLPYSDPDALVAVDHAAPGINLPSVGAAPFLYYTYREQSKAFQDIGLWRRDNASVTGLAEPEQILTIRVTDGVLPLLGVTPFLGRLFTPADDSPNAPLTIILSYGYWQSRFGGDPAAIGRRLLVDGNAHEIIGVLPASFRFLDRNPAAFRPLGFDRNKVFIGNFSYQAIARLAPAVGLPAATADVRRLIPTAISAFPPVPGFSVSMFKESRLGPALKPLKDDLVGDVGRVLWLIMGTIALVLLIACANVANLLLVRTDSRQQELAVRAALGAGWERIAGELVAESVVLGIAGGIVGLGFAYGGVRLLIALAPANLPRLNEIAIDAPVLAFTFAISVFAGMLFGVIPVLKYARPHLNATLRSAGRTASLSRERHRARNTLVVAQVALALVLLVASGLMIRTFQALRHVDPGFTRPDDLLTMRISIPQSAVPNPDDVVRMQQAIAEKISTVSGVASVGLATTIPMEGQGGWSDPVFPEDKAGTESKAPVLRSFKFIAPGLLQTMGNSVIAGRDYTWDDLYSKRDVAIVSENLARELWRDPRAAIGKRIRETNKSAWREIIGVVNDERDDGVDKPAPAFVCWPLLMRNFEGNDVFTMRTVAVIVRSSRAASSGFLNEVSRAVWAVNPNLPLANVRTMRDVYDRSLARTSFTLVMLGISGAMALLLGIAGIYGVISYAVSQRSREIGIRMALGARREEVTRMFVGQGLQLAGAGIVLGLAATIALTRLIASLLFDVSPIDPATYIGVSVGLAGAAMLASYVPALRAARVDPVESLRAE